MKSEIDYPTRELNEYLRNAGLGNLALDEQTYPQVSALDDRTAAALIAQIRQTLDTAQREAPPVTQWDATAEAMLMDDDGSPQAQEQQDRFWRAISTALFAAHALIRLGDISVFPLILDMAASMPGHPSELAIEVLRRYVDPNGLLDPEELVKQAGVWWQAKHQA
jgi:hypothetical protein